MEVEKQSSNENSSPRIALVDEHGNNLNNNNNSNSKVSDAPQLNNGRRNYMNYGFMRMEEDKTHKKLGLAKIRKSKLRIARRVSSPEATKIRNQQQQRQAPPTEPIQLTSTQMDEQGFIICDRCCPICPHVFSTIPKKLDHVNQQHIAPGACSREDDEAEPDQRILLRTVPMIENKQATQKAFAYKVEDIQEHNKNTPNTKNSLPKESNHNKNVICGGCLKGMKDKRKLNQHWCNECTSPDNNEAIKRWKLKGLYSCGICVDFTRMAKESIKRHLRRAHKISLIKDEVKSKSGKQWDKFKL
jgi:uncharacterized CHY-type Zn-finger protein